MATPADGIPPRMQMFLFHTPPLVSGDPFLSSNGGDPGDIVYHEYTHGLSNRLVVDALELNVGCVAGRRDGRGMG
jgi:hypothetical protein